MGRIRRVFSENFDSRAVYAYNPYIGNSQIGNREDEIMADRVKVDVWFDYA